MAHIKLNLLLAGQVIKRVKHRKKKLRPSRPSRKNELWYKYELLALVKKLQAQTEASLIADMRQHWFQDATPDLAAIIRQIKLAASKFGGLNDFANRLARIAAERNLRDTDSKLINSIRSAIGVNISAALSKEGAIQRAVKAAITENIELIKSIPVKYFDRLETIVRKNFETGMRYETIVEKIKEVGNVTESRAKLIARDQTSKMNSSFNQVRQTDLGIDKYIWQTSDDERVRPEHVEHEGKTFRWSEPPANTGHPGEDIQCRCVAIPVFDLADMEKEIGI